MQAKGTLIIIGGHEDKGEIAGENLTIHKKKKTQSHFEILGKLISKIPRAHHNIEIIAAASTIPVEVEELYISSYKREGFTQVGFISIESVSDANSQEAIKKVNGAHAVFFAGGNQNKLVSLLGDTDLLAAIKHKYINDKNFMVGGTSAGAMAIPETIITGGIIREALYKEDMKLAKGLGLIDHIIVDTHFIKRGRFARLAHAVTMQPNCLGIGMEEDTALMISEGVNVECIGSGMVVLIDGSEIKSTNISTADDSTAIVVENLKVSILAEGSKYVMQI